MGFLLFLVWLALASYAVAGLCVLILDRYRG